jgi:hypothetical protein
MKGSLNICYVQTPLAFLSRDSRISLACQTKRRPGGTNPPGFSTLHISTESVNVSNRLCTLAGFSYQPSPLSPCRPSPGHHPSLLPVFRRTQLAQPVYRISPPAFCIRLRTLPFSLSPHFILPAAPTQYGHSLHVAAHQNGYRKWPVFVEFLRLQTARDRRFPSLWFSVSLLSRADYTMLS